MGKMNIEELVNYVITNFMGFEDPNAVEKYNETYLAILKANGFPIEAKGALSLKEIIRIAFIIGVAEGYINKDIVKVVNDE